MKYIVYQITNNVNHKIYIGVHKTHNEHDTYYGSGNAIKKAITKYGKHNFTKDILFTFDNPKEAFEKEAELVTKEFVKSNKNYNLKIGGWHPNDIENSYKMISETKSGVATTKHTEDSKEKIRKYRKSVVTINDGNVEKRHPKDLDIPKGWKLGRLDKNKQQRTPRTYLYISEEGETQRITNLKKWCDENNLNYYNINDCIDKGIIRPSTNKQSPTRIFMIGKEIKRID